MGFLVFLLVILCCLLSAVPSFGKIISKTWEVEYMHWSPDCVESIVMGINGKFPGPEIRAVVGDTLNITVKNKLHTEGVVIHWHGILQKGTPWFDGTASISQCPINPGETFVYKFVVDKPGTYFYHGHYGMQRAAGLYGSLIVENPKEGKEDPSRFPLYDDEFNLLLSDWWHRGVHAQEVDLSSNPFRFIGEPQTLLINGRGQYNCSITVPTVPNSRLPIPYPFPPTPSDRSSKIQCNYDVTTEIGAQHKKQCGPVILNVKQGKTYRLRVASTTSLSSLNLQIQNHKMTVVEADGNYVKPFEVDDLDIYSGESYSVLITTDKLQISDKHWISVGVRGRKPDTPQALAILSYDDNNNNDNNAYPISDPPITPAWDNYTHSISFVNKLFANAAPQRLKNPNEKVRTIKLLNTQSKINGYIKWAINGISLTLPQTPYLGSIKYDLKDFDQTALPDEYDGKEGRVSSGVFNIAHNEVVHVILQNAKMLDGKHSEIHPWHLHGHDFWVLGYGEGTFDETKAKLNFVNPPLKNTVSVFPHGWTALRFKADNPGVWAFHCHIEPHLHMGMGVIFVEAENVIKKMSVPNEAISCGYSAKFLMNPNNHHHHHHHHHHSHHHKTNVLPAPSPQG